jgi:hypothetical protein
VKSALSPLAAPYGRLSRFRLGLSFGRALRRLQAKRGKAAQFVGLVVSDRRKAPERQGHRFALAI